MRPWHFLLVLVTVLASACGVDDDSKPDTAYFQSFKGLNQELRQRVDDDLPENFLSLFADITLAEQEQALVEGLAVVREIGEDHLAGLDSLDPPPYAQTAHAEYRAAFEETLLDYEQHLSEIRDSGATTLEDFWAAVFSDAGGPVDTRVEDACNQLQQLAIHHGIGTDLECEQD